MAWLFLFVFLSQPNKKTPTFALSKFKKMKVRNTLIFILIIFAAIAGVMAVFPKDGIRIGENFVLHCPSFSDFLPSSAKEESTVNLDSLLSNQIDIDEHIPEKNPAKLKDIQIYHFF